MVAIFVRKAFKESLVESCADLPTEAIAAVKASTFKNGVLTVVAPQLVSAELSMRSGGLLRVINKVLGRRVVLRLKFRSG